ncbi:MAG: glycosyltransferase family 39 protein [Vicinamibacteria bacterium]|nr:glycosyltransferase family 39 protein [Vicinamibacteria bacterium]
MVIGLMRRCDPLLILLFLAGLLVAGIEVRTARPIRFIGHADPAVYAEMAESLITRGNLSVDYVSYYFIRYPGLPRPEDHWPPLYSFAIAPFFLMLGKSAFAAKLPSILLFSFALPPLVFALTKEVGGNRLAALVSGMSVLVYPALFEYSLQALSEILLACIVGAFALALAKSLDNQRWHLVAGLLMGLASYAKGSGVLLFGCYLFFQLIASHEQPFLRRLANRRVLLGLLSGFLVLAPWLIRNTLHFGDPLFTTHKFEMSRWSGRLEDDGFLLHEDGQRPPRFRDRFNEGWSASIDALANNLKLALWWFALDLGSGFGSWRQVSAHTYITHIPALLGFLFWSGNRKRHALWPIVVVQLFFLALAFVVIRRLAAPYVPLMLAMGWATLSAALGACVQRVVPRSGRIRRLAAGGALAALGAVVVWSSVGAVRSAYARGGPPYEEVGRDFVGREYIDMGRWLRKNLPADTVTATRDPWELHFYSGQPAVQIPNASIHRTFAALKSYGAEYLIPNQQRPLLDPLVSGRVPGLEVVYRNKWTALYKIRYDLIPTE